MRALWNRFSIVWCRAFHPEASWPINGHYHCPACLRVYPVQWHEDGGFARRETFKTDPSGRRREFGVLEFQRDRD